MNDTTSRDIITEDRPNTPKGKSPATQQAPAMLYATEPRETDNKIELRYYAKGSPVAEVLPRAHFEKVTHRKFAAFIVTAVNHHEPLVQVLRDYVQRLGTLHKKDFDFHTKEQYQSAVSLLASLNNFK